MVVSLLVRNQSFLLQKTTGKIEMENRGQRTYVGAAPEPSKQVSTKHNAFTKDFTVSSYFFAFTCV